MSRNIWVISDTHFGHTNIIKYCDRPFSNSEKMDEVMVENWNSVVKDKDIVYHLGDVYLPKNKMNCYYSALFSKLKGRKRLILGNHDEGKDVLLNKTFQKIRMWRMFPEFGLLLTHVPVHISVLKREPGRNMLNIHGHIHNNEAPSKDHQCVCVEHINYTPVNIEELRIK